MNQGMNDKLKAAYALNLWTVSVSQIVEYGDINIMKQEYDTIMNNLNLQRMPKDDALLDVIKRIMDEIINIQIDTGEMEFVEREYQHQLNNAVWSAVPNVGAIFATNNAVAMGVTLATQVGIGYMNYRRNKSEYELKYEKDKWQIKKKRMIHLNGLQQELFETAWRLAEKYEFPDEYRLTDKQISAYNKALIEPHLLKRYYKLKAMEDSFSAYPAFWYQMGSVANRIFRSDMFSDSEDNKDDYRENAIHAFEKYEELNNFNLLRSDILTSSWALEYLELLNLSSSKDPNRAKGLIEQAEKFSGGANDVAELCAFAYLRCGYEESAIRVFHNLVNNNYNEVINTKLLSALYIKQIRSGDSKAKMSYRELKEIANPDFILEMPDSSKDLTKWAPEWDKEYVDRINQGEEDSREKTERKDKINEKINQFFRGKKIGIIYHDKRKKTAEVFENILSDIAKSGGISSGYLISKISLKAYEKKQDEDDTRYDHIIFLGNSKEAKLVYKDETWNYRDYNTKIITRGKKTVIMCRSLKESQLNELLDEAGKLAEYNPALQEKIPEKVGKPEPWIQMGLAGNILEEVMLDKYLFDNLRYGFKDTVKDTVKGAPKKLGKVIMNAASMPLAGIVDGIGVVRQKVINTTQRERIRNLQYIIAIQRYLELEELVSENQLFDN